MSKHKLNIDDLLYNQLHESAMDAEGIDWDSFSAKRKRKRGFIWFYCTLALVLISSAIVLITNWNSKNANKPNNTLSQNKEIKETTRSDWGIKKNESYDSKNSNPLIENTSEFNHNKANLPKSRKVQTKMLIKNRDTAVLNNPINYESVPPIERDAFLIRPKSIIQLDYQIAFIPTINKTNDIPYKPNFKSKTKQNLFFDIQVGQGVNNPVFKVTNLGKSFIHKDYENIRKSSEVAISGFNFQIAVGKNIKRWNYSIGLGVINTRMQGNYNFNYSDKPVIDLDGSIKSYLKEVPTQINYSSKHSLTFIEIPLTAQYNWMNYGSFSSGIRLGSFTQFLNQINGQLPNPLYLDQKERLSTENYKARTSSIQLALPIHYQLNKKSYLILIPEFRRGLGFNQIQNYYKTDFNYWGLNINYRIKF